MLYDAANVYLVCSISEDTSLSLSNQAQYLTVTMESVAYFHKLIVGSNMDMLSVSLVVGKPYVIFVLNC